MKDHLDWEERKSRIFAVVDRQINDPGLWCGATTIGEAYVQFALRHLHAVIEGDESLALLYSEKYGTE